MNAYNNIVTLKRRMDLSSTSGQGWNDADLRILLEAASRQIDIYCNRFFYVDEQTWYFDGAASPMWLPDILVVSTFKLDEDSDATFESTLTEDTDFALYPLNTYPKWEAAVLTQGDYGSFASGIKKGVEITATFGYGDGISATPYSDSGNNVQDDPLSSSATTIAVTDGTLFGAGQTLRIESEQVYILSISSNTLTVTRAVNGTTAASHVQDTDIYIYDYPRPIMEAALIQAMRWYKRRETAFQDSVITEIGQIVSYKGLDPDIALIVSKYAKMGIG